MEGSSTTKRGFYKYGSIICLVISGLIAYFGDWIRFTSAVVSLIKIGDNWILNSIIDYLDSANIVAYEHATAGKLTLLDIHTVLDSFGSFYGISGGDDRFSMLALIPLVFVFILAASVILELVMRFLNKNIVYVTAAVELIIWVVLLVFVIITNNNLKEDLGFNINVFRISFFPVLAFVLAAASGVLWAFYKKEEALQASYGGYANPAAGMMKRGFDAEKMGQFAAASIIPIIFTIISYLALGSVRYIGMSAGMRGAFRFILYIFTGIATGLAIIYADRRNHYYLITYGLIGLIARFINFYLSLGIISRSFRLILSCLCPEILIAVVLYFMGRYVKDMPAKRFLMAGMVSLLWFFFIPILTYGTYMSVTLGGEDVIYVIFIFVTLVLYMLFNGIFCRILNIEPDMQLLNSRAGQSISNGIRNAFTVQNDPQMGAYGQPPRKDDYGQPRRDAYNGQAPQDRGYGQPQNAYNGQAPQDRGYGRPQNAYNGQAPQDRGYGQPQNAYNGQAPQDRGYGQPQRSAYGNSAQNAGYGQSMSKGTSPQAHQPGNAGNDGSYQPAAKNPTSPDVYEDSSDTVFYGVESPSDAGRKSSGSEQKQIEDMIRENENTISELHRQLGKKFAAMSDRPEELKKDPEYMNMYAEVEKLKKQNAALKQKNSEAGNNMKRCPVCGTQLRSDAKFCGACGNPVR